VDRVRGEVYVADTMNDLVGVYDRDGLPLFAFGYNGEFKEPLKAVTDPQGRIYVLAGIGRKIKVFNCWGEYLQDFPFVAIAEEAVPTALTVDEQGNLYIADATSGQILVYDPAYRLKLQFGARGHGNGHFVSVQAIAVDAEGDIYVADARSVPLQVFSPRGKFLRGWGKHAAGPENFSFPSGVAIDRDGRVIVVDTIRQAILVFTKEGRFLGRYGGLGSQPGAVTYPTDVAADSDGRIYVVERLGSRLQIMEQRLGAVERVPEKQKRDRRIPERVREELWQSIERFRQKIHRR
jgi:DNA-binding beta-propeller fold protein YncE